MPWGCGEGGCGGVKGATGFQRARNEKPGTQSGLVPEYRVRSA